jgi:hypothetical protein
MSQARLNPTSQMSTTVNQYDQGQQGFRPPMNEEKRMEMFAAMDPAKIAAMRNVRFDCAFQENNPLMDDRG